VSTAAPQPVSFSPYKRLARDLLAQRRVGDRLPPGPTSFSMARTRSFAANPLPLLLDCYERLGPIFSVRILHAKSVFMLGPEANHYMTVSHAENFRWREGSLGDLIPLLGDGMLTIDGAYHRRARRIMLPAFHRERIAAANTTMVQETERALDAWSPGARVDVYSWTRALALRIAMRALFGFDPDAAGGRVDVTTEFEHALGFYGRDYLLQTLRGPLTPWKRMHRSRRMLDEVIYGEIARRRRTGELGEDVLSLLMAARDEEDGSEFSDRELRDQVMTLLFAGHDTTTSTVSFLFYELACNPAELEALLAEQEEVIGGRTPTAAELTTGLPRLEMAIDETLRLYPAAWVGPRRSVEAFEFAGQHVPGDFPVNYCSWASHRLPDVFEQPDAFRPDRLAPEARAAMPKGAYVPFGGGSRTCLGMRFGQLEIKTIATLVLQRFALELEPGYELSIRQMPTISPRGGLPVIVHERSARPAAASV